MASLFADLQVAGQTYRVLHCSFETQQATYLRGRVSTKVRYEPVQLVLEVPSGDELLAWAADPHKHQEANLVFLNAAGGSALETLRLPAAYCVTYGESFHQGNDQDGAYVCQLTLSDPSGWTIEAGGPATAAVAAPAAAPSGLAALATGAASLAAGAGALALGGAPAAASAVSEAAIAQLVASVQSGAQERIATLSATKRGPCYSGIYDPLTQQTHYGENFNLAKAAGRAQFKEFSDNAHPVVKSRLAAYSAALQAGTATAAATAGTPGAHSEVVALDKILKARDAHTGREATDADVAELYLHNRCTLNSSMAGQPMNRCDNCSALTSGINTIGHT